MKVKYAIGFLGIFVVVGLGSIFSSSFASSQDAKFYLEGDWCFNSPYNSETESNLNMGYSTCYLVKEQNGEKHKTEIRNCNKDGEDPYDFCPMSIYSGGEGIKLGATYDENTIAFISREGATEFGESMLVGLINHSDGTIKTLPRVGYTWASVMSLPSSLSLRLEYFNEKDGCREREGSNYSLDCYNISKLTGAQLEEFEESLRKERNRYQKYAYYESVYVYGTVTKADVEADDKIRQEYKDGVGYVVDNGIAYGFSNGRFGESLPITRGEFSTIVGRSLARFNGEKIPSEVRNACLGEVSPNTVIFNDVDFNNVHAKWICVMKNMDIIRGYGNGENFGPDDNITYAQAAKVVLRTFGETSLPNDADLRMYTDQMKEEGLELWTASQSDTGIDTQLRRAEMAQWIYMFQTGVRYPLD